MKMLATWSIILLSTLFLNIEDAQSQKTFTDAQIQAGLPCYVSLNDDPKFARLLPKVGPIQPEKGYRPSIELLSNKTKATKEDKVAISYWGKVRQECDQKSLAYVQAHSSAEVFARQQNASNLFYSLLVKLFAGDINFGDFSQSRYELNQTLTAQAREQYDREKAKRDDEAKLAAAKNNVEVKRVAEVLARRTELEQERLATIVELRQKQSENAKVREEQQQSGLQNLNCQIDSLLGGNCQQYNSAVDKINTFDEAQEIEWVKGAITATTYVRSVYELHHSLVKIDSYRREGFFFDYKIAKAFDEGKMSLSDARYLMEKNNNQIEERRAARAPPTSISFSCKSETFGGVVKTKCH